MSDIRQNNVFGGSEAVCFTWHQTLIFYPSDWYCQCHQINVYKGSYNRLGWWAEADESIFFILDVNILWWSLGDDRYVSMFVCL